MIYLKTTINYGLKKPEGTDVVNIEDLNYNTDVIDQKIKEVDNKASSIIIPVTSVNSKTGAVTLTSSDLGAETPSAAQAKANTAESNAKAYTDTKVAGVTTQLGESTTILTAGGTANAITLSISTLTNGKKYSFKANANSTGNVTINGKVFKRLDGTQIGSGGVKSGKIYDFYYDSATDCVFILAKATGTATPSDVLAGKDYSNDDGEQVGTMPNNGAVTITPSNVDQTIAVGYHNGSGKVKALVLEAGDVLFATLDNMKLNSSTIWTKQKEVKIDAAGTIRIKFDLNPARNDEIAYAQIYVNGVAKGTLRQVAYQISAITFTEDIMINANDNVQIYTKTLNGYSNAVLRNFRIYTTVKYAQPTIVLD